MSVASEEERAPSVGRGRRRRSWSQEAKRQIVAETFEPGASVSIVARRHDVNANQVFSWRRQLGDEPRSFVPVVVTAEPVSCRVPSSTEESGALPDHGAAASAVMTGRMEIVLSGGGRIVVDKTVNTAALARVIEALGRR
jgi:transposase